MTEQDLIDLSAALDDIGRGGSGKLLYAIARSEHTIAEFKRMADTLEVGNIDGWITHAQFVDRGVHPTFDAIASVGKTLTSLRDRLQMITEMIQTSALIVEAEATSHNTQLLRRIGSNWRWTQLGVVALIVLTLLGELAGDSIGTVLGELISSALTRADLPR